MEAVGNIVDYRPPQARSQHTAYLGMVFFLGSWAMMFAGLFFAYGVVRAHAAVWPPMDQPELPILLPAINTGLLVISSLMLQAALVAFRRNRPGPATGRLAAATALGIAFIALQCLVWARLYGDGLTPDGGPYPSVFYGLTGFHALHVLVGIGALLGLTVRALRGAFGPPRHLPVRLWAMYWHFVGVVWVAMFVTIYVL
jgi:cytochrome c oxidase subunit 3